MDKYSRQIGAFGLEAMSKLMNLKVLIVGLKCVPRTVRYPNSACIPYRLAISYALRCYCVSCLSER